MTLSAATPAVLRPAGRAGSARAASAGAKHAPIAEYARKYRQEGVATIANQRQRSKTWPPPMKTLFYRKATRFGLLFSLALSAVLAYGARSAVALGTCGPTERPDALSGGCRTCNDITTPASITSDKLSIVFDLARVQNASFTVSNNVGTFNTAGTNLAQFNFKVPDPASVSLPPVTGSIPIVFPVSYEAFPHIPDIKVTWGPWIGGDSGVSVNALLSGHIDVHISAAPIVVNPRLTLTNLPVTITFGTDPSGNATMSPSQVVVAPVGPHGSVDGCGAFDWCDGLLRGPIESAVQGQLQSTLASQIRTALNGKDDSSPFWFGLMNDLANAPLPLLSDPAGFALPDVNKATPGGTTTFWTVLPDGFSYAGGKVTARFNSSEGLCYIDCRPRSQAQLCGPNSCGTGDDGCGDTITCPGTCGFGQICTDNQCRVCVPLTCADVGFKCGVVSNGCEGFLSNCQICEGFTTCRNGECVGFGGPDGPFCKDCRNRGGTCISAPNATNRCVFQ
jgi:hypothetical protein